jgi:hypothetical protein
MALPAGLGSAVLKDLVLIGEEEVEEEDDIDEEPLVESRYTPSRAPPFVLSSRDKPM